MASSSKPCSDEELQKAREDLKEFIARNPILEEFDSSSDEDEEEEEKVDLQKKKKKKMYVMPQEQVEMLLNIQCTLHENNPIDRLAEEDKDRYGDFKTLIDVARVITRSYHDFIRDCQERIRHEVETKGYFAYEATDDEAEDDNDDATPSLQGPREGEDAGDIHLES